MSNTFPPVLGPNSVLRTPQGAYAVRPILARTNHPVYVLRPHAMRAEFTGISLDVFPSPTGDDASIDAIRAEYYFPSQTNFQWIACISNVSKSPNTPLGFPYNTFHPITYHVTEKYTRQVEWGRLRPLVDRDPSVTDEEYQAALQWFYHEIAWEPFMASGGNLPLRLIYWLEPIKLGMALGEVSATRAVEVVAYGASRVEFEHLLSEIIDLHAHPELIDTFQNALDAMRR